MTNLVERSLVGQGVENGGHIPTVDDGDGKGCGTDDATEGVVDAGGRVNTSWVDGGSARGQGQGGGSDGGE